VGRNQLINFEARYNLLSLQYVALERLLSQWRESISQACAPM
jgi:hypothetical protein